MQRRDLVCRFAAKCQEIIPCACLMQKLGSYSGVAQGLPPFFLHGSGLDLVFRVLQFHWPCGQLVAAISLNPKNYNGHWICWGGCTWAWQRGVSPQVIMSQGDRCSCSWMPPMLMYPCHLVWICEHVEGCDLIGTLKFKYQQKKISILSSYVIAEKGPRLPSGAPANLTRHLTFCFD